MQKIDLAKIRGNLKYGDNKKIHQLTGLSLSFISQVLNGKKNSDDVLEAAVKIGAANIARKQAINSIIDGNLHKDGHLHVDGNIPKDGHLHLDGNMSKDNDLKKKDEIK